MLIRSVISLAIPLWLDRGKLVHALLHSGALTFLEAARLRTISISMKESDAENK